MTGQLLINIDGHRVYADEKCYRVFHPSTCGRLKGLGPTLHIEPSVVVYSLTHDCKLELSWEQEQKIMEALSVTQ